VTLDVENFGRLFDRLKAIDLFGSAPPEPPWKDFPDAQAVADALSGGADLVALALKEAYVGPLEQSVPRLLTALRGDPTTLETLTGAVYQHSDEEVAPELRRFLAVISNFYRSFLSARQRLRAGFPLVEQAPPMAMFQHEGRNGPFTLPVDAIEQLIGGKVGVVSLPATYRKDPLIWASLAHETGGHDVLHADEHLLPELRAGVAAMFGGGHIDPSHPISSTQLLGALWAYWMDESASDIYGVLNIGPTFGHNLAVFFSALLAQGSSSSEKPALRTSSGADERGLLDPHPTDLLRLDLHIGAIQSLQSLSQTTRTEYVSELRALSEHLSGGATSIELRGVLLLDNGGGIRINTSLPLADMQAAARRVGSFIATARLEALENHSIQDLETWDDADEQTARTIASAIAAGKTIVGAGDDAQLLAGTMLALLKDAGRYEAATEALNQALDESFANDPIWGSPRRDLLWLRGDTAIDESILSEHFVEILAIDGTAMGR
jgi:hypothetical protein